MNDTRIDPPLPHSREAEVAFLGAILLDTAGSTEEMNRLTRTDFFLPLHRIIFEAMKQLKQAGKPTNDTVLLHESLGASAELEAAGGAAYLSSLPDGLPKIANVSHYADVIKTKAQARNLIQQFQSGIDRLFTANGDLADTLQQVKIDSVRMCMEFGRKDSTLFRTAADLAEEADAPEFVVKPYILAGAVTELVAKIKAGKTTYVLGEIVRQAIQRGPVVYLTEQPSTSFRVALERAGLLGAEHLHVLSFNAVVGMEWVAIAKIAAEKCHQIRAVLLVVDTLSHFSGLDGDSENDSGAAITCMKPLQQAAAAGIAVLTVRHERKSGGEIGDAGRGSSAFGGAADTLLTLRRPEGRTRATLRKIECISRFEGLPAEAIYEFVDGGYEYRGTENEVSEREALDLVLARAPETEEEAKALDDLLEGSGVARTTAKRVIQGLLTKGVLKQTGKGKKGSPFRYFLPEKDSGQTPHIDGQNENAPRPL